MPKKKSKIQKGASNGTVSEKSQLIAEKPAVTATIQTDAVQPKKSTLQRLHQEYGLIAPIATVAAAVIGVVGLLYVNGKLPFSSVQKPSEKNEAGQMIDQRGQASVQHNNYVINNQTTAKTVNIQKNQITQSSQQNNKKELFEVYLQNDADNAVSYQFYDYAQRIWRLSTVQAAEEHRILSIEPRVLLALQDHTGEVYIFNTNDLSAADANLKANKIRYNIKKIELTAVPSAEAQNQSDAKSFVWKVFSNAREVLPEPSLNLLNGKPVVFAP